MTGKHKMSTLTGQLNYSAMEHIVTKVKGKSGQMIECVILPLESNWIEKTEKDGKVYLHQGIAVYDIAPEKQKNGQTHTIKINPKKEIKDALKAAGKFTPFLGNLKDWSAPTAEVNTSEQFDAGAVQTDDDLPF
jgi:hypothetical protein